MTRITGVYMVPLCSMQLLLAYSSGDSHLSQTLGELGGGGEFEC